MTAPSNTVTAAVDAVRDKMATMSDSAPLRDAALREARVPTSNECPALFESHGVDPRREVLSSFDAQLAPHTPGAITQTVTASGVPDRRNEQTRERLRLRVRSEFHEMPDLILNPAAAARLFGIREDICVRVLKELQTEGLLYSSGERYATNRRRRFRP